VNNKEPPTNTHHSGDGSDHRVDSDADEDYEENHEDKTPLHIDGDDDSLYFDNSTSTDNNLAPTTTDDEDSQFHFYFYFYFYHLVLTFLVELDLHLSHIQLTYFVPLPKRNFLLHQPQNGTETFFSVRDKFYFLFPRLVHPLKETREFSRFFSTLLIMDDDMKKY
jgi:hypothetical protein